MILHSMTREEEIEIRPPQSRWLLTTPLPSTTRFVLRGPNTGVYMDRLARREWGWVSYGAGDAGELLFLS
jgi:hypothetical protein